MKRTRISTSEQRANQIRYAQNIVLSSSKYLKNEPNGHKQKMEIGFFFFRAMSKIISLHFWPDPMPRDFFWV